MTRPDTKRPGAVDCAAIAAAAALAWLCSACGEKPAQPAPRDARATAPVAADAAPGDAGAPEPALATDEDLRALGAVPAWQAVVDRGRYLARRQQEGIVYGRLGPTVSAAEPAYRWLLDDTQGAGSLGIRLAGASPGVLDDALEGRRVVLWGAWHVDENRAWFWRARRASAMEPDHEPTQPAQPDAQPGHQIVAIPSPPEDAIPVSRIERGPVTITFQVTRIPRDPSSGWEIADRSDWQAKALLLLPGEQATYGAQDLRSPSEHWRLERKVTYTIAVRRFMPAKPGKLTRLRATTAPRRIARAAPGARP